MVADNPKYQYPEHWVIGMNEDRFYFHRYQDNKIVETYRPVDQKDAAIWAVAITSGREPPRQLCDLDRQTQAKQDHLHDVSAGRDRHPLTKGEVE